MLKIKKKTALYLFIFLSLTSIKNTFGQERKEITPIHEFLQKNADSTLILEYENNWLHITQYQVLSKKEDTIAIYMYKPLPQIDKRIILPKAMSYKMYQRNFLNAFSIPVDINFYFNPKYLPKDSLKLFWKKIETLKPWTIKDDAVEGNGCPIEDKNGVSISDGGGITLFLITKAEIKKLYFYAPDFFEEYCPGRKGRISIMKLSKLFTSYFKDKGM